MLQLGESWPKLGGDGRPRFRAEVDEGKDDELRCKSDEGLRGVCVSDCTWEEGAGDGERVEEGESRRVEKGCEIGRTWPAPESETSEVSEDDGGRSRVDVCEVEGEVLQVCEGRSRSINAEQSFWRSSCSYLEQGAAA
jgi:hypothetical protein